MRGKQSIHPFTSMTGTVITPRAQGGKRISCFIDARAGTKKERRERERESERERKKRPKKKRLDYSIPKRKRSLEKCKQGSNNWEQWCPRWEAIITGAKPKSSSIGPCKGIPWLIEPSDWLEGFDHSLIPSARLKWPKISSLLTTQINPLFDSKGREKSKQEQSAILPAVTIPSTWRGREGEDPTKNKKQTVTARDSLSSVLPLSSSTTTTTVQFDQDDIRSINQSIKPITRSTCLSW